MREKEKQENRWTFKSLVRILESEYCLTKVQYFQSGDMPTILLGFVDRVWENRDIDDWRRQAALLTQPKSRKMFTDVQTSALEIYKSTDWEIPENLRKFLEQYDENKLRECLIKIIKIETKADNITHQTELNKLLDLAKFENLSEFFFRALVDSILWRDNFMAPSLTSDFFYSDNSSINFNKSEQNYSIYELYDFANAAENSNNLSAAFDFYKLLAKKGDSWGQTMLGFAYHHGRGTATDYAAAYKYYLQAAEQEQPSAICEIGHLFYHGLGQERNLSKALKYYTRAAELGNGEGMYFLGLFYEQGLATSKDKQEALKWFIKSQKRGFPSAKHKLEEYKNEE